MPRVLLDTNIIVAGLISASGPPARLLRAWLAGNFKLVTAAEQIDELARVLDYKHLRPRISAVQRQEFVESMRALAVMATDLPSLTVSRDAADNVILAIAVAGDADLIVSGDKPDILALKNVRGIPIVRARTALTRLDLMDD